MSSRMKRAKNRVACAAKGYRISVLVIVWPKPGSLVIQAMPSNVVCNILLFVSGIS